jgi:hypothetical protein
MSNRIDGVYKTHYAPHLNPGNTGLVGSSTDLIQGMLARMLVEISMNRFKWDGLPEEVDIRWMEMNLLRHALAVFHYDNEYDRYFAMQGSGAGPVNMLGNPTEFIVYGNQYYQKTLKAEDCVPIWGNYTRIPDWDIIEVYSRRIAEMDRSIEINAKNARRTRIIAVTENGRMTAENINDQIDQGKAAVKVGTGINLQDMFQYFDLGGDPAAIINLDMVRNRQWNQVMTLLGVNNANQDKKERLVAAEVSGNDDMVAAIRATNLQSRQQACEAINTKYGLNVEVSYVSDELRDDVKTAELKNTNQDGADE